MTRVLIVGGSGGIGSATAQECARRGIWPVVGYCGNQIEAQSLVDKCGMGEVVKIDLLSAENRALDTLPPIHALIHCAGASTPCTDLLDCTDEEIRRLVELHALGPLGICRTMTALSGELRTIVFVLSTAAIVGGGPYGLSKAVGLSVARILSRELGQRGITVHAVLPGWTETKMAMAAAQAQGQTIAEIRSAHLDGRLLDPNQVARVCIDLALVSGSGEPSRLIWWDRRSSRDPLTFGLDSLPAIPGVCACEA
jgi:NAD(P)-dependent dehydrogenase (short-subunit alcohol dehydrogenase family)